MDALPSSLVIAALLAAGLTTGAAEAQRPAGCRPVPNRPLEVEVRVEVPPTRYDRTRSRTELAGFSPHGPGVRILGLTRSQLSWSSRAGYGRYPEGTGVCAWVEHIEVELRYNTLDVFVAKEYDTSGCAYRAILAHEKRHVQIAREHVDRYSRRMKSVLDSARVPTARAPMPAATLEDVFGQAGAEIRRLLAPVIDTMNDALARAQDAIDTPEAYARVRQGCTDW